MRFEVVKQDLYSFTRATLLELFLKAKSDEGKISFAKALGSFSFHNYTGHFREPELESFFEDFSFRTFSNFRYVKPHFNNPHLVHVVTRTYPIGGHSRFLENLIQLDKTHVHHLIVLDQQDVPRRQELDNLIHSQNGNIKYLEEEVLIKKCRELLHFVTEIGGKIMLHHHPDDLIPSLSLSVLKENFEIIFFNHADHCFSFGFELASKVINIREEAHRMTVHWRGVRNSYVLPLPILKPEFQPSDVSRIKLKYNIPEGKKVGLCIAGPHKLKIKDGFHFFKTIQKALDENKDLLVLMVGVDENSTQDENLGYIGHERLRLLGTINDPSELQFIADIAIDPIPMGSYTALLETCHYGAYPMVSYNQAPLFNLYDDPSFKGNYAISLTEAAYLDQIRNSLNYVTEVDKKLRCGQISLYHSRELWLKSYFRILQLNDLNEIVELPKVNHKLVFLNQNEDKVKNSLLFVLHANIEHLHFFTNFGLMMRLMCYDFSIREVGSLIKSKIRLK
jgi:hypothetical protein